MRITQEIIDLLSEHHLTVSTAESCTGGMIADMLVDIAGVSQCFEEGYVSYSNDAKVKNLGVLPQTLETYGAVSRETAKEMAIGVKKRADSDFGLATTGIAGPGGGTDQKPVGLVYISCAFGTTVKTQRYEFDGNRYQIRTLAGEAALELLLSCIRKYILQDGSDKK